MVLIPILMMMMTVMMTRSNEITVPRHWYNIFMDNVIVVLYTRSFFSVSICCSYIVALVVNASRRLQRHTGAERLIVIIFLPPKPCIIYVYAERTRSIFRRRTAIRSNHFFRSFVSHTLDTFSSPSVRNWWAYVGLLRAALLSRGGPGQFVCLCVVAIARAATRLSYRFPLLPRRIAHESALCLDL